MDDHDLKTLKDVEAPVPRPGARDAAMRAGMQAFEQANPQGGQNKSLSPQGLWKPLRLISNAINHALDWTMKHQAFAGLALVAAVAVPVAFSVVRESTPPKPAATGGILDIMSVNSGETAPEAPKSQPTVIQPNRSGRANAPAETEAVGDAVTARNPAQEAKPKAAPLKLNELAQGGSQGSGLAHIAPAPGSSQFGTAPARPKARVLRRSSERQTRTASLDRSDGRTRLKSARKPRAEKRIATGVFNDQQPVLVPEQDRDNFATFESNPTKQVSKEPVSTFSIDVDTSSYAFARKLIQQGRLPRRAAVRSEEMINYFSYNYPRPTDASVPFKPTVGIYPTPWNPETKLLHIGLKGYDIERTEKPRSNLVFLLDVSGSMNAPDKLPLLKIAFRLLVDTLDQNDTVSIVTYAGRAGTVLEPTKASNKAKILGALDQLRSGGSTAGAQGIRQAYALAEQNLDEDGVNRVILATDGDFNVGIVDQGQLKDYIAAKRKTGVFLSILGFGSGNYNDALMQTLAQNGNGNAAYIDSLREAQKVLVEEAGSTLFPIAKDVKIQIEFNPTLVSEYRLIGYETRALRNEDFNNDKVDAGDIGSGHTVTALYEITPVGAKRQSVDPLRYQSAEAREVSQPAAGATNADEYAFLKLRYKLPKEDTSKLIRLPVTKDVEVDAIAQASTEIRFAASVAAFAEKLRGATTLGDFGYDEIIALASGARGEDRFGYRNEFVSLVRLAKALAVVQAQ